MMKWWRGFSILSGILLGVCMVSTASAAEVDVDGDVYRQMIEAGYVSQDDVKVYKNIFKSLKNNDIETADDALEDLESDILLGHVLAEKYLSKTYKSSFEELKDWLSQYGDLPQARRIYRLAGKKGDKEDLALPESCVTADYSTSLLNSESSAYAKLSPKNKDFVLKQVKSFYRYLNKGKTRAARRVLEGKKFRMTIPDKYWDELSVKLAFVYLLDNYDKLAFEWAQKPARRSKSATAYWVAGLASWKMKKYQQAAEYFGKLGALKDNDEWLEAAGAYWAFRANMKLNRKQKAEQELKTAAKYSRTFYGMLAAYALGQKIEYNWDETPFWNDFSNPQYAAGLVESPYIRRAVALYHAKQPELADQEIENGYAEMTEKQKEAVLFLLKQNNRHRMAIKVSNDLRDDEKNITYDGIAYPLPEWEPLNGWKTERSLLLALMRQESGFNPYAVSSAGARGVMQLLPSTAYYITKDRQLKKNKNKLFDVTYNMEAGQRYVNYLMAKEFIDGNLFFMMAAYNAGPGNLMKWKKKMRYLNDPLLFIELLPAAQTRIYIERVMANYWIYSMRMGEFPESLEQLNSGLWPTL